MKKVFLSAEDVRKKAERTYAHFQPAAIRHRYGMDPKGGRVAVNGYIYVYGYVLKDNGKLVLAVDGPMDQDKAENIASMLMEGKFVTLQTRDLAKAKKIIAAQIAEAEKSFAPALQRKYTQILRQEKKQ